MQEVWKDIVGYENLYQISNLGNVKSVEKYVNSCLKHNTKIKRKEKMLKQYNKSGYLQVALSKNGIKMFFLVHRLVAQAFIPNPNNLPQINHKDENKQNNNINNLEWCDRKYNCNYGTRNSKIYNRTSFRKGHIPWNKGLKYVKK